MPPAHEQFAGPGDQQTAPHPDTRLVELANAQWGVVARRQLAAIGLTPTMVRDRMARGTLTRVHHGVYAVGHSRLRPEGHLFAAVAAVGPVAALSHRDAAWLHGLRPSNRTRIDVTTTRRVASTPRIDVHRTRVLTPADVTALDGIPVTTVARTIVDLASVVSREQLLKAINEAELRRVLDVGAIASAMERTLTRRGRGRAALKEALTLHAQRGLELPHEGLELAFSAFIDRHGFPRPQLNAWVEGREVDACWRAERIAVELDGWSAHRSRQAGERDRAKTNFLQLRGWTVLRYTHHQLAAEPQRAAAELRAALAQAGR